MNRLAQSLHWLLSRLEVYTLSPSTRDGLRSLFTGSVDAPCDEFPPQDGVYAHASVLPLHAALDALPCPMCGRLISMRYFNTHIEWCGEEFPVLLYQRPEDQELPF